MRLPPRRTARRRDRAADRRRAPCRGRQCLADPGDRRAAGARARATAGLTCRCCGSRKHNFWTDGARELFDCAGQGRIDVFFLSGGQIDGHGNVNLVSIGDYDAPEGALPRLVRLGLSLLRGAEGDPVPHRAFAPHAGAARSISSARRARATRTCSAPGGPIALITNRCLFSFAGRALHAASVHPGHTVEEVIEHTGFDFDRPANGAGDAGALARDAQADARDGGAATGRGLSAVRARRCSASGEAAFARLKCCRHYGRDRFAAP